MIVRRPRGRDQRRHPGQDHVRAAADEDGRRRGAVGHRATARRSRSSRSAPSTEPGRRSRSRCPTCCPSSPPAVHGKVQGINDVQPRVPGQVHRDPDRSPRHPRLRPADSADLLVLPADDRPRHAGGRGVAVAGGCGWSARGATPRRLAGSGAGSLRAGASSAMPMLPADRQLLRLDLHRDRPPALGGLRRAATADAVSPTWRDRRGRSPRSSSSPCSTRCSRSSR